MYPSIMWAMRPCFWCSFWWLWAATCHRRAMLRLYGKLKTHNQLFFERLNNNPLVQLHKHNGISLTENICKAACEDCCYHFFGERYYSWIAQETDSGPCRRKQKRKWGTTYYWKTLHVRCIGKTDNYLGIKQFTFGNRLLHTNTSLLGMKPHRKIWTSHLGHTPGGLYGWW